MYSSAYVNCANGEAIADAIRLAEELLRVAEKGVPTCTDDCCLFLYGVIRDCGYKIRRAAEQEKFSIPQKDKFYRRLQ